MALRGPLGAKIALGGDGYLIYPVIQKLVKKRKIEERQINCLRLFATSAIRENLPGLIEFDVYKGDDEKSIMQAARRRNRPAPTGWISWSIARRERCFFITVNLNMTASSISTAHPNRVTMARADMMLLARRFEQTLSHMMTDIQENGTYMDLWRVSYVGSVPYVARDNRTRYRGGTNVPAGWREIDSSGRRLIEYVRTGYRVEFSKETGSLHAHIFVGVIGRCLNRFNGQMFAQALKLNLNQLQANAPNGSSAFDLSLNHLPHVSVRLMKREYSLETNWGRFSAYGDKETKTVDEMIHEHFDTISAQLPNMTEDVERVRDENLFRNDDREGDQLNNMLTRQDERWENINAQIDNEVDALGIVLPASRRRRRRGHTYTLGYLRNQRRERLRNLRGDNQ
jgi:hypothetical protein